VKRAIISDIHGNLDALEAVLQEIQRRGITETYCLGDTVGYGPNPRECLDIVMTLAACILGNHDQGALFDPEGFSSSAERAIFWTRSQLQGPIDPSHPDDPALHELQQKRWHFLCGLPRCLREDPFLFVHGSPRNPLAEYVFPEDVYNRKKMERLFPMIPQYCFQGHTHVPGIFTERGEFLRPADVQGGYRLDGVRAMINVGSVGQPRDGDPRACFVTLEDGLIRYHRVEYPVEETIAKMALIPELDPFLGQRLRKGQ
jgi:diadenosine tetraphosphatase ApaH/serine/threonine PP2A family protein phosphatase